MSPESAIAVIRHALTLIDDGELDDLPPLLTPTVTYRSPPHLVQFPGNVVAFLRQERDGLPGRRLLVHEVFSDAVGSRVVVTALWSYGRLTSQVCLVFQLSGELIDDVAVYGGLGRILHDLGAQRVA